MRSINFPALACRVIMACLLLRATVPADALVIASIDPGNEQHAITRMATGANLVYAWHPDRLFADGEVAHIIKDIGLGALRWPGGTVATFYHWDALTGQGWSDSWSPNFDPSKNQAPENFMDLDEYLALIDQTGAEIMLGVNMSSGKEWNRVTEGIAEAKRLMEYCKARGYDVKYIYLDNENYHETNNYNRDDDADGQSWGPWSYGQSLAAYAAALKTVYPDAKLIANWNNNVGSTSFRSSMESMLSAAGNVIDYIDLHFYWEWDTAAWTLWKSQKPMKNTRTSKTYREDVIQANAIFAQLGYPHIRTVVLEWNIAPGPWETDPEHTHFRTALMQTEMQMQFLQGGLDIGMLYTLENPLSDFNTTKHIISDGEPTATALWLWLFSKAADKTVVQAGSDKAGVYVVALKGAQGEIVVYLLNKTDTNETVELGLSGMSLSDVSEGWRLDDGGNGLGALQSIDLWESGGRLRTTLLANSLNMIGLGYPSIPPPAVPVMQSHLIQAVPPGIIAAWDHSAGAPDSAVDGVEASLGGAIYATDTAAGSTDGTFGGGLPGAETGLTAFAVRMENGKNTVSLRIINRSGMPLQLNSVHFDYAPWWAKSPKDVALVYAGGDLAGVAVGAVVQSVAGLPELSGKQGNYADFDWPLETLPDRVLEHDEMAVFNLVASNATVDGNASNSAFDNIAISGESDISSPFAMVLSWRAQTGRKYQVKASSTLQPDDWQSQTGTLIGQPGDMSATVGLDTLPQFIRLEVAP